MKARAKLFVVLGTVVLLVAALSFATPAGPLLAQAQTGSGTTTTSSTDRTISVSGVGQIQVQPDEAILSLGVQTQATEAAAAISQNNQQMTAVVSALKTAGVASTDIRTLTLSLTPQYQQPQPNSSGQTGTPAIVGYVATNVVQVTTKDPANLGALIDAATKAGANQINGIEFDLSNPTAALDQARQAAWQDAQHRATQLAQLAGVQLGNVMTITEATPTPPRPFAEALAPAAAGSSVPVESGTISIELDLSVTWAIQ